MKNIAKVEILIINKTALQTKTVIDKKEWNINV